MANGGSAATGAIEGFLGGFERGAQFRRQRTADKLALEDRQRRLVAEELQRGRQGVADEQAAAEAARARVRFQIETGQAPGAAPVDPPGDPVSGISTTGGDYDPSVLPSVPVPDAVGQLRRDVGEEMTLAGAGAVFPGFHRVGPSADERERERVTALRTSVSAYLTATPEERAVMQQDPQVIGALEELGLLTGVMSRSAAAAQPVPPSPAQRFIGEEGRYWTFNPRGSQGEQVAPLFYGGEQMRSPEPVDNFARTAAMNAMNAISRLDMYDFSEEEFALQPDIVARRYGFEDEAQAMQIISDAVRGGGEDEAEARATELREQGLSDDEVIEQLREEGLISG